MTIILEDSNNPSNINYEYPNDDLNQGLNDDNSYDGDQDDIEVDLDDDADSVKSPRSVGGFNASTPIKSSTQNGDDCFFKRSTKTKRGILPKNATNVMKKWLFQHIIVSYFLYMW